MLARIGQIAEPCTHARGMHTFEPLGMGYSALFLSFSKHHSAHTYIITFAIAECLTAQAERFAKTVRTKHVQIQTLQINSHKCPGGGRHPTGASLQQNLPAVQRLWRPLP